MISIRLDDLASVDAPLACPAGSRSDALKATVFKIQTFKGDACYA